MKIDDKRKFTIISQGSVYALPIWRVKEGFGISLTGQEQTIQFVRGSKLGYEKVETKDGILHETLLSMMIEDLKYKDDIVPSKEGNLAITNLQQALFWMEERQRERTSRGVVGTYKK